jgi:hypothetical protein
MQHKGRKGTALSSIAVYECLWCAWKSRTISAFWRGQTGMYAVISLIAETDKTGMTVDGVERNCCHCERQLVLPYSLKTAILTVAATANLLDLPYVVRLVLMTRGNRQAGAANPSG